MSRFGDECLVSYTDGHHWGNDFRESQWRKMAEECVSNMNLYSDDETRDQIENWYTIGHLLHGGDIYGSSSTSSIKPERMTDEVVSRCHWPRGFRCNDDLKLNNKKMSKWTGNFMTLRQAIEEFSADATRFSLADAGDGVDDVNFEPDTANAAILQLTNELAWMEEVIASESSLRSGPPSTYADRVFANEINIAIKMD
ncbi:hypothetical protein CDL15_Pgr007739 [Punica granatum]|uniref:Methionyl/Leucyl tRNA synthetase domain-containing protein n=1 Tax=Punica granatum TaxID=22663 RepID=A0A218XB22_PUNGR|nr:hypothetical protein CDL15_Pgr007739 [Punica granatum]